ncbi:MAG: glutathione binding-like protein, partial [Pseudooceanicola atlanticus]
EGRDWIADDFSIADIALVPWIKALDFYGAKEVVGWDDHKNLIAWVDRFNARPAVEKGSSIPPRP